MSDSEPESGVPHTADEGTAGDRQPAVAEKGRRHQRTAPARAGSEGARPSQGGPSPDAGAGDAGAGDAGDEKAVKDRWWVDFGPKDNSQAEPTAAPPVPVGEKFYRSANGFEQEAARARLTDSNLKLLIEANPAEGEWGYVLLGEKPFPAADAERIRQSVNLPGYSRGVLIDSGRSVRLLITGTPIGERILELALVKEPSFDCWIEEEWVCERVFKDRKRALRGIHDLIEHYLSPQGIAAWESARARV